jgi:hypothetical protein
MTKRKEEVVDYNNDTHNHNINTSIREELKPIQRSIALLRQDIRKIVREELTSASLNGGIQG